MSYFLQAVNFHLGVVEGLDICVTLGKLHIHGVPALGDGQHHQSGHAVPQAVNFHLGVVEGLDICVALGEQLTVARSPVSDLDILLE